jgi:hypothetical protein
LTDSIVLTLATLDEMTQIRGQFVEQMLMLSSSFRCDQIYKYNIYDFGHTLLCYLSWT